MKYAPNIILEGTLHKNKNNIGSKGVIIVDDEGNKQFEFEKEELILSDRLTSKVNSLVDSYNEAKSVTTELELGKLITEQLLFNTEDRSGKYKTKVDGKDRK